MLKFLNRIFFFDDTNFVLRSFISPIIFFYFISSLSFLLIQHNISLKNASNTLQTILFVLETWTKTFFMSVYSAERWVTITLKSKCSSYLQSPQRWITNISYLCLAYLHVGVCLNGQRYLDIYIHMINFFYFECNKTLFRILHYIHVTLKFI